MDARPVDGTAQAGAGSDWWRQAVVYQVYPRSFADSDGNGLGDIRGISNGIPYLADLGVDAIWLSPFYPSAFADGGYDVADYRNVHPDLGSLSDFDDLMQAAHSHHMKVIIDIVPNHTSNLHPWFAEALAAPSGSAARDRYIFRKGTGPTGELPPSDWLANFGGSAWTRVADGEWYLHLFAPEQPDLNWDNAEVREDFRRTIRFWSDRGVDGFRIDVAHGLVKDLSEPYREAVAPGGSLPPDGSDPLYDRDGVHEIYREWRTVFNEYSPARIAVAEAWVPAERRTLYASKDGLGQAFNFDLLAAPWDGPTFRRIIADNLALAEKSGSSSTWVLDNHDSVRSPSRYGLPDDVDLDAWLMADGTNPPVDASRGIRRARAAALLILALPGSTYLYQGQELGLFEVPDIPTDVLQDPTWEQSGHTKKGRDGVRVPIPWTTSEPSFGFGAVPGWLPQPAQFAELSVDAQSGDPSSTLEFFRAALMLRRRLEGPERLEWVPASHPEVVAFARDGGWQCITNFGTDPVPMPEGVVLLPSRPLASGSLPGETTVWLRTARGRHKG